MDGMAATWTRDTPWRQGHVLTAEAIQALGLVHPETPESTCVVVIGHDCDLANDALQIEPAVEVIVGRILPKGDGNYFWAKAPRTLHVDVQRNGTATVVELIATAKRFIPKQALAAFLPDATYSFPGKSLSALRSWLPFPKETPSSMVEQLTRKTLDVLSFVRADRHEERDHLADGSVAAGPVALLAALPGRIELRFRRRRRRRAARTTRADASANGDAAGTDRPANSDRRETH